MLPRWARLVRTMNLRDAEKAREMERAGKYWVCKSNKPGLNPESAMFNWVCGFRQSPTFSKVCLPRLHMGLYEQVLR